MEELSFDEAMQRFLGDEKPIAWGLPELVAKKIEGWREDPAVLRTLISILISDLADRRYEGLVKANQRYGSEEVIDD